MRNERPPCALTDPNDREVERQIRRMTRRSFGTGAIAGLAALAGWGWLRTRPDENGIPWPLRRVLEWNATLAQAYFRPTRLAPTYSTSVARMPRVNGHLGLGDGFDPATWSLRLENSAGEEAADRLTLDQIQALPRVETVTELKCIEGWSDPVCWTGVRLADLASRFGKATHSGRPADFQRVSFRPVSLRFVVHAGHGLLRRARHRKRAAPTNIALLRDGRPTIDSGARCRRSASSSPSNTGSRISSGSEPYVSLMNARPTTGLTRLRLVRRPLSGAGFKGKMKATFTSASRAERRPLRAHEMQSPSTMGWPEKRCFLRTPQALRRSRACRSESIPKNSSRKTNRR